MLTSKLHISAILMLVLIGGISICAQTSADNKGSIFGKPDDEDDNRPKSFKETLVKLRIDKEKKEFDEMIERGVQALKLAEELEKAYSHNGKLHASELNKLAAIEKLVKKIRNELGGDDDDDKNVDTQAGYGGKPKPIAQREAIRSFRSTTLDLLEELKKTSRFTISAAAIQASNAVLKLTRFLRLSR